METAGIKIVVDGSDAVKSVGSLKQQLRDAQKEVAQLSDKFGETSKEAMAAAKRAADLKDRIGDAKELTDAFNPDAKFKAFGSALQGVAGGFSAVQGALGLVGVESEEVEQTLLKVQSAMALSQGIDSVTSSIDAFKRLGAIIQSSTLFQKANNVVTAIATGLQKAFGVATVGTGRAFTVLKAAIVSTGIGALVVVIGTLVSKMGEMSDATDEAAEKAEKLSQELAGLDRIMKENQNYIDRQIQIIENEEKIKDLRAQGGDQDAAIAELRKKNIDAEIQNIKVELATKEGLLSVEDELALKAQEFRLTKEKSRIDIEAEAKAQQKAGEAAKIAADKAANASKESAQKRKEAEEIVLDAKTKLLSQKRQEEIAIERDYEDKVKKLKEAGIKDFSELEELKQRALKQVNEKYRQEEELRIKEFEDSLNELRTKTRLASIKDEFQKQRAEVQVNFEEQRKEIIKNEKTTAFQKIALLSELKKQEVQALAVIDDEEEKKKEAKRITDIDKQIAKNETDLEIERQLLDEKQRILEDQLSRSIISQEQYNEQYDALSRARMDIDEKEYQNKIAQVQAISGVLSGLTNLVGQDTATGKALAVAQATIDTYTSASTIFRQAAKNPITIANPAFPYLMAAPAVLQGIARVKQITAVKVPGGGASTPSMAGGQAPIAPAAPLINTRTQLDNESIQRLGNATNRAYVIESDVSSSQERIRRINRAARLG
jgi:hypothetical protein